MALSETGKWLEQALWKVCSDGDSALQLDSEALYSLVSYCEMAPPTDASEYLLNIVGDDRSKDIVAEYLRRRGVAPNVVPEAKMQAYHKPREEESWSTSSKKPAKQRAGTSDGQGSVPAHSEHKSPLYSGFGVLSSENIVQKGKRPVGKGKKIGKGLSLGEALKGQVAFARRGLCECQCTRHKLINNCLSCGRIVCEQEGEGPCHFCGALVLKEGSDYAGLEGLHVPPATEAEASAEEFKNRLVEYDRTSASRTTVIDDQSDYFEINGHTWLSEKEKRLLQDRHNEEDRIAEERRKRLVVSIDLLGRKVVMAGEENGKENEESISILGSEMFTGNELQKVPRIKRNPYLANAPVFIDPSRAGTSGKAVTSEQRHSSSRKVNGLLKSVRVQHDDVLVEALSRHNLQEMQINLKDGSNACQGAKARADSQREEVEALLECQPATTDCQDPAGTTKSAIEKVQSKRNNRSKNQEASGQALSPSLLMQKQMERKEANGANAKYKEPNKVLGP